MSHRRKENEAAIKLRQLGDENVSQQQKTSLLEQYAALLHNEYSQHPRKVLSRVNGIVDGLGSIGWNIDHLREDHGKLSWELQVSSDKMSQVLSGKYNTKHDAVDAYTTAWNQFAYLLLEIEDLEMEAETLLKNYLIEAEKRGSN